jgi:opacity protein-like surface antigen
MTQLNALRHMFIWALLFFFLLVLPPSSSFASSLLGFKGRDYFRVSTFAAKFDDAELGFNDTLTNNVAKAAEAKLETAVGVGYSGALGFDFDSGLTTELEYSHRSVDTNKVTSSIGEVKAPGKYTLNTLIGNVGERFLSSSEFTPYFGGGLGIAWHEIADNIGLGNSDSTFVYQLLVGVEYSINSQTKIGLGYGYLGTSDPDFEGATLDIGVHNIGVTFRHYWSGEPVRRAERKFTGIRVSREELFDKPPKERKKLSVPPLRKTKYGQKPEQDNRSYEGYSLPRLESSQDGS